MTQTKEEWTNEEIIDNVVASFSWDEAGDFVHKNKLLALIIKIKRELQEKWLPANEAILIKKIENIIQEFKEKECNNECDKDSSDCYSCHLLDRFKRKLRD